MHQLRLALWVFFFSPFSLGSDFVCVCSFWGVRKAELLMQAATHDS